MDLDKPFRTYDEQIDLLQDRGLCITDREFANHALSTPKCKLPKTTHGGRIMLFFNANFICY